MCCSLSLALLVPRPLLGVAVCVLHRPAVCSKSKHEGKERCPYIELLQVLLLLKVRWVVEGCCCTTVVYCNSPRASAVCE